MSEARTIVLDLDGTLITCANKQTALFSCIVTRRGHRADPARFWGFKRDGRSTREAARALGLGDDLASEIALEWIARIEEPFWLSLDRCYDDVLETLSSLRREGFRLVLLTARQHAHWLTGQLSSLGLDTALDEVIVVMPDAASRQKADHLRALSPLLFVGDSESDAAAATQAGVRFVGLERGQRSRAFLQGRGVSRIAGSLREVRCLLPHGLD